MAHLVFPQLRKRFIRIGIAPALGTYLARLVMTQIKSRGQEGAVQYLKRVCEQALNWYTKNGKRVEWVATQHGFPKKLLPIKGVVTEEQFFRLLKLFRVIEVSEPTNTQVAKTYHAAVDPFNGSQAAVSMIAEYIKLGCTYQFPFRKYVLDSKPQMVTRVFSRVMSRSGPVRGCPEPPIKESLEILASHKPLLDLPYVSDLFTPLRPSSVKMITEMLSSRERVPYVGEVHAAQEPGVKLRMYAAPYTVVQCALSPIYDWIVDNYAKKVKQVCTWDQLSGASWAQSELQTGKTVYSLDLSTATCRFPLDPQVEMLKVLGLPTHALDALVYVCRGRWKVSSGMGPHNGEEMVWSVGQPLGIRPSIAMFTLAHALLLIGICVSLGRNPDCFRVLGDDLVCSDCLVSEVYQQLVQAAGVPISWSKSHVSSTYAEFAGASITTDLTVRPGQFRELTAKNLIPLVREFGVLPDTIFKREQKLIAFMEGKYDPPDLGEYSFLLKASSLVMEDLLNTLFEPIPKAPVWVFKIKDIIQKQLKEFSFAVRIDNLMPDYEQFVDRFPYRELCDEDDLRLEILYPDGSHRKFVYLQWIKSLIGFSSLGLQDSFLQGFYLLMAYAAGDISKSFWVGRISLQRAIEISYLLRSIVLGWLYLPPLNVERNQLRKFQRALSLA